MRRSAARGGGERRERREIGVDEKFFQPASPFPILRSPLPQNLGTDPTKVNKIKGLRGFGGRSGGGGRMAGAEKIFKNFHLTPCAADTK